LYVEAVGRGLQVDKNLLAMLSAHEANRRYFREAYRTGQHGWGQDLPSPYAVDFLRRLARVVPGGEVLDIGCGEGRHAVAAARLGFRVTAIDYEPLALRRARQVAEAKGVRGIVFRRLDVFDMPFPESSFDVIVDYGFLHHQRKADWPAFKSSILRVLKPGGYYVLSVFSPRFRLFRGSRRRWHIAYGAYRRCFTAEDITGLFGSEFDFMEMREERGTGGGFWHVLMKRSMRAA